jgi:DivIVA domain-containing protein
MPCPFRLSLGQRGTILRVSLVLLLVLLAVIAAIAVVAAGRGGSLPDADPDRSLRGSLPEGEVSRSAVDGLRFTLALRGYRMDEVDDVLDRLVGELEERDRRIQELDARLQGRDRAEG